MHGSAPVQPRLGARGRLPAAILRVQGDLVERRAARRALQRADQLVQLARPGVERRFRGLRSQGAADRAVLRQRGQSASRRGPESPQVPTGHRLANAPQPVQSRSALRPSEGSVRPGLAKVGGELGGRRVAQ